MPTKIGVVFMGVNSCGDPGVSRPCYAASGPGDCSGCGREGSGWRPALFYGLEGQWGDGLPPLSPCYGRSASGYRKHTRVTEASIAGQFECLSTTWARPQTNEFKPRAEGGPQARGYRLKLCG